MAFNDTLPLRVHDLENRIKVNNRRITDLNISLNAERHECDCEYCDYEDDYDSINEEEIETQIDELKNENVLISDTIRKLKLYAKDHNIKLEGDKS